VLRVIGARLLQMIPVIFGVTLVSFIVVNILPGNIVYTILGTGYTPQAAAALRKQLHLNQSIIVRYFDWLGGMVHGNFGQSLITHQSVGSAIWQAAPPTLELIILAQIVAVFLGVVFAVSSVASPTPWVDRTATSLSLVGTSVPSFVSALVLIIVFSVHWHLVPSMGWVDPSTGGWGTNLTAMAVPSIVLGISIFPGYMRIFRREMYDQLDNEEYVTLARMKGIKKKRVIFRHVVRNSALGFITLISLSTGLLIGGAVIIEQIFNIPGIGSLLLNGIQGRDATMVEGCIVVIAVWIIFLNLAADIVYALFDPRVRAT
jgi:peptide/nickel transport system permease protein